MWSIFSKRFKNMRKEPAQKSATVAALCGRAKSCVLSALPLVAATLFNLMPVQAEDQAPSGGDYFIDENVIQDFARMLKVDPGDIDFRAMFNSLQRSLEEEPFGDLEALERDHARAAVPRRGGHEETDSKSLDTMLPRITVTKHFRFGGGIPFQTVAPSPVSEEWRAGSRSASSYFQKAMQDALRLVQETPPLPDCEKAGAEKWEHHTENPESDKALLQDFLYIRGAVPADALSRFGSAVAVTSCGSEPGDGCAIAKQITGVRCLPTRLTIQNGRVTRLEGSKALKKFEFRSSSEGATTQQSHRGDPGGRAP